MSLNVNPNNLIDALAFVEKHTGRSCAESLNRAALHTIIGSGGYPGAMQLTPKASRASIMALSASQLRAGVVARLKRTGKWPVPPGELDRLVKRERGRRISAIGYAAYAGYNNAAKALGGRGLKTNGGFMRSEAARGTGSKASAANLVAILINTATAIERIGGPALQKGLDNAAQDLVDYAIKKMQQGMDKVKTK